ncbi:hypothetical protein L218DRAFT_946173 [Marasmius fiardii PR-910]|nr:hypothetical protein L218DRAFT_946173 [Marasmius fiardii PR-910]
MTNNFSQRESSSGATAPTPTWTKEVPTKANVEELLELVTGLPNIKARMSEVRGSQYLFSSGDEKNATYYLWNMVNEAGGQIKSPTNIDDIENQIQKDITRVQVTPLPDPRGPDEDFEKRISNGWEFYADLATVVYLHPTYSRPDHCEDCKPLKRAGMLEYGRKNEVVKEESERTASSDSPGSGHGMVSRARTSVIRSTVSSFLVVDLTVKLPFHLWLSSIQVLNFDNSVQLSKKPRFFVNGTPHKRGSRAILNNQIHTKAVDWEWGGGERCQGVAGRVWEAVLATNDLKFKYHHKPLSSVSH